MKKDFFILKTIQKPEVNLKRKKTFKKLESNKLIKSNKVKEDAAHKSFQENTFYFKLKVLITKLQSYKFAS